MLTTADKKYIDLAIDSAIKKSRKDFEGYFSVLRNDSERHLGILMEQNRHEFQLVRELFETRPSREQVDEKFEEHVKIWHR